jgi:hypothetical protein
MGINKNPRTMQRGNTIQEHAYGIDMEQSSDPVINNSNSVEDIGGS